MLALVANATRDTDVAIAAALAGVWLWRRHKLGRTVRKTVRWVAACAAVVAAAEVSPALCVIVCGCVIGVWLAHQKRRRHARTHTRMMRHVWKQLNRHGGLGGNPAYGQWMASAGWRRQKLAALNRAHHRCEVPGCRGRMLEVHHNNNDVYNHLPAARPVDLTVLCHTHHGAVTHLHRYRGYTIAQATRMVMDAEVRAA